MVYARGAKPDGKRIRAELRATTRWHFFVYSSAVPCTIWLSKFCARSKSPAGHSDDHAEWLRSSSDVLTQVSTSRAGAPASRRMRRPCTSTCPARRAAHLTWSIRERDTCWRRDSTKTASQAKGRTRARRGAMDAWSRVQICKTHRC